MLCNINKPFIFCIYFNKRTRSFFTIFNAIIVPLLFHCTDYAQMSLNMDIGQINVFVLLLTVYCSDSQHFFLLEYPNINPIKWWHI